ncbi:MAG: hypothetical protein V3T61_04980 [Acidobacteriota bacterium]
MQVGKVGALQLRRQLEGSIESTPDPLLKNYPELKKLTTGLWPLTADN